MCELSTISDIRPHLVERHHKVDTKSSMKIFPIVS